MGSSRIALIVASALSFAVANTAAAATITVTFSGTIGWIDDEDANFGGFFTPGDSFSGTLVYDTEAATDSQPDPTIGDYSFPAPSAPTGFSVTLHGVDFASDPAGPFTIGVLDSPDPGTGQGEDSLTTGTGAITVAAPVTGVGLWLLDGTASAFDSDALPIALDLADFTSPGGGIASGAAVIFYNGTSEAWGQIDSLIAIPEPGSSVLLGIGLVGLAAAGRRRNRRRCSRARDDERSLISL